MPYQATILEVFIASPSDVAAEREVAREVIAQHNATFARNSYQVLQPVGWETHSAPDLSGRPQQMINDRLLEHADLLIGIFWTRVGTATGTSVSGTIEEIGRHKDAGKPVMLYFSTRPVVPDALDSIQFGKLKDFKAWAMEEGLIEEYETLDQFRAKLASQLPITLHHHFQSTIHSVGEAATRQVDLSSDGAELLKSAAAGGGEIRVLRHMAGTDISAGNRAFVVDDNPRTLARWEAALNEIEGYGLISDVGYQRQIFRITHQGYGVLDQLGFEEAPGT